MRDNLPSIFDGDSFFSDGFSIFNTLLSQAQARMNELMEDPDTKVYKSPDGTTTICYNSKSSVDCLPPSRAKKTIIYNDYPITDAGTDRQTGDYEVTVFLPGFKKENVYVDFKDNYLNVYATRGKNWKDVLVPSKDGVTYEPPVEPEKDLNTKEIKNICYVQKQSKDRPIEEQHIFVDVTKHNISKLEKKLEDGILTIHIPSREETKPALLTFNE